MEGFCLDKGNIETRSLLGGGGELLREKEGCRYYRVYGTFQSA